MAEQWDKRLRVQEGTGSCRNYTARRGGERLLASCRVQTTERDGKALRGLYKQYVQAREARELAVSVKHSSGASAGSATLVLHRVRDGRAEVSVVPDPVRVLISFASVALTVPI